jgi:hypothetical protein
MVHIIGWGSTHGSVALLTETRKRRQIGNEVRPERAIESLQEGIRIVTDAYPEVVPLSATALYNCYGLAFASRRTWILDEGEVKKVLEDDGFGELPWDPRFWEAGDIVLYCLDEEVSHVAVIASKQPVLQSGDFKVHVISAWGESGEYVHPMEVVSPLLGKPCRVLSQRKVL